MYKDIMFALVLLVLLPTPNVLFAISEGTDRIITDFYSCDSLGYPQDYFPKKTTAYFNVTVRNLAHDPKNISAYLEVQDTLSVPIGSDELHTTIPSDASAYYIMSVFIPKWAYVGIATAYASVFLEGTPADSENTNFYIGREDLTPPVIHLSSPENSTYETESVPLVFTVNERTSWTGYSLNDLKNATIAGNTTLAGLTNGSYNVVVWANDTSGNAGSSEIVYFTILIVHDVAVIDLKCSSAEVYVGQTVDITAIVQNEGTVTESFNVTVCANTTAVETLTAASLFPGNQTALVFIWNTTSLDRGNYIISAFAEPVPNETETADNSYMDGIVNVMPRPDVAVTGIKPSKTCIAQGYSTLINVTIENQGGDTGTFNITAYANTTGIQTKVVTLASGNRTTVTFTWNTAGFAKGKYIVSAFAEPVLGEIDTGDNMLADGWIAVTIPGDVNGDFVCDGKDIAIIARAYGTTPDKPLWNPNADINGDLRVDGKELAIAAKNFGQRDP